MDRKIAIILLLIFFIFRVVFLNGSEVFFDSPEYITRLSYNNFFIALTSGHLPLHIGYILIFWPIYHLANIFSFDPGITILIFQSILAAASVFCLYEIVKILTDKNIAFITSAIASLIPLYWITNVTIMMETTYITFFLFCFYFLVKYFTSSKNSNSQYYLVLSAIMFIFSALTHLAIFLWIPLLFFAGYSLNKNRLIPYFLTICVSIILFSILNGYFIAAPQGISLQEGIASLYISKLNEHARFSIDINSFLIFARNFLIPLLRSNTNLIVFLGFLALFKLRTRKNLLILSLLWILPALITNQWWDSVFFGRHSLIASLGLAFLAGMMIKNNKLAQLAVYTYLLFVSLPALTLLNKPIPYIEEAEAVKKLSPGGLLIESHFARPQVDKKYDGKVIFVDEPGWEKEKISSEISEFLKNKRPVFVTAQALSEPYGLYSGPYLHTLSLSYKKEFILKQIIESFTLIRYKTINEQDNLTVYRIISTEPSSYPNIKKMDMHERRVDYYDGLTQLWFVVRNLFVKKS